MTDKTIRSILQNGPDGPESVAGLAARPVVERIAIRDATAGLKPQQAYNPIPASQLLGSREARRTNERLAELLELAKADAEEQRANAGVERGRARRNLVAAWVASGVAVLSLIAQVVFFFLAK
ncbi:hypothetical protein GCM10009592_14510 [Brachybacterium rhamnosum]|uniref:Uncharacterized protein n=1 Tax=Brachybacterium rhamnosum TaxID=173361 RepID=A0ABW4PWD3_9MICO